MPSRAPRPLTAPRPQAAPRTVRRRLPGNLTTADFTRGLLDQVQALLPTELQSLECRYQSGLVKFFAPNEPAIHFELWLHRASSRVELALHFETRDPERNQQLLDFVADELPFLKH